MTGQRIDLRLSREQDVIAISVRSQPRSPLLLFEFGQNETNVRRIVDALRLTQGP